MSTLLAIDFGERRLGVAWVSRSGGLPAALVTLARRSDRQVIEELAALVKEYDASTLVLGEPVGLEGERGENCERVRRFAEKVRQRTGLPVHLQPETLTTVAASERLATQGIDPQRFRPGLDAAAAALILEEFLAHTSKSEGQERDEDGSAAQVPGEPRTSGPASDQR